MTTKINGIDVSEYFIEVVDEGGSTIDYKIFPNSERLLVEKIFEQNQQLARLQEENKELYKALEEIRKEANRLLYEQNPIYGYNNSNYFEILVKYVLAKTKEVLNDRY